MDETSNENFPVKAGFFYPLPSAHHARKGLIPCWFGSSTRGQLKRIGQKAIFWLCLIPGHFDFDMLLTSLQSCKDPFLHSLLIQKELIRISS